MMRPGTTCGEVSALCLPIVKDKAVMLRKSEGGSVI